MRRVLSTVLMLMSVFVANLNANECNDQDCPNQEFSCFVSPQDLLLDHDAISLNVDGVFYPVQALEKRGDRWIARLDLSNTANYCPQGHLTCRNCGMCHKERCRYYMRPCKLWD
jgi:hypothetical protein